MPAAAWVTLVLTTLIVAAAALGLIRVIGHLIAAHRSLAVVIGAVEAVADRTSTVPTVLPSVNANLGPVAEFCESI